MFLFLPNCNRASNVNLRQRRIVVGTLASFRALVGHDKDGGNYEHVENVAELLVVPPANIQLFAVSFSGVTVER